MSGPWKRQLKLEVKVDPRMHITLRAIVASMVITRLGALFNISFEVALQAIVSLGMLIVSSLTFYCINTGCLV